MRRLGGLSMCIALSAGCVLTFDGQNKVTRHPSPTEIRVREGTLAGTAAVMPDGTVRFAIELAKLCQRDRVTIEEIGVDRKKRFTNAGVVVTAASIALVPFGIYLFSQIETEGDAGLIKDGSTGYLIGGVFAELTAIIAVPFLLIFRYGEQQGFPETKGYTKTSERTIPEGTETVPCNDGAAPAGDLVLTTPWGATSTAKPGLDGVTIFAVDWTAERASAFTSAQLADGWQIASPVAKSSAAWRPSGGEVTQLAQLIAQARERVVVGPTPAQLAPGIEAGAKGIEIGATSELVVTIKNAGGSTATGVTAKTRSSVAALHGVTFTFGAIQPGATATRSVAVKLGAEVVDDSATIQLVVTDGAGKSVEVSKKLSLTRALCAGGKLTRAQYDAKRAKLKKTLEEGLITQAELDRLDGDLLRCLE